MVKNVLRLSILCILFAGLYGTALAKNKFEKEVDKEKEAVKLLREVQSGGYGIVTAEELKKLIDSGKDNINKIVTRFYLTRRYRSHGERLKFLSL